MEQFDQLLTCCICLDRYRNPKLLPCQHSYCMEPCMEGLVDYVKRQASRTVRTIDADVKFNSVKLSFVPFGLGMNLMGLRVE